MSGLRDLLAPPDPDLRVKPSPTLMEGRVIDDADPDGQIKVTIPSYDGGARAYDTFGHWPDAQAGDEVRVQIDEYGTPVVTAWQPQ